jgi:hypothetical protein
MVDKHCGAGVKVVKSGTAMAMGLRNYSMIDR